MKEMSKGYCFMLSGRYLVMLIVFLPFTMKGQDALLKFFINDVVDQVVDKNDLKHFNYRNSSFTIEGEKLDVTEVSKDFLKKYRDFPAAILNITDSTAINWSDYIGKRGSALDEKQSKRYKFIWGISRDTLPYGTPEKIVDSLNNLEPDGVYVCIDKDWSKRKIERKFEKAVKKKLKELNYYSFSAPVFSDDKKYAVIDVNEIGHGNKYLFRYNGKRWIMITSFHWRIS